MATWPAYATESEADDYWEAHGDPAAWSGAASTDKIAALRAASEYLDFMFGSRWIGTRATTTQERDWPRVNAEDIDGVALDDDTTPQAVVDATCYLALEHVNNGDLMPALDYRGEVKREVDRVGQISTDIEYLGGKSQTKSYPAVEGMLLGRGLITTRSTAYRA